MKVVKVLWIDDSENWAISAQKNLEIISEKYKVNFRFINSINGEDIVQQCSMYDFDAIVMDYDMKPFSGEVYIRNVRDEEHLEHIPILFYSQNTSVDLADLVKEFGNIQCLYRPNLEDKIKELFFKG